MNDFVNSLATLINQNSTLVWIAIAVLVAHKLGLFTNIWPYIQPFLPKQPSPAPNPGPEPAPDPIISPRNPLADLMKKLLDRLINPQQQLSFGDPVIKPAPSQAEVMEHTIGVTALMSMLWADPKSRQLAAQFVISNMPPQGQQKPPGAPSVLQRDG